MHAHDHYDTLGVSRTEAQHGVDTAYHDLDRHYYPAHTGMIPALRRVQHAHDVLSEQRRRAAYDRARNQSPAQPGQLTDAPRSTAELSLMDDFQGTRPTPDEVWHLLRANFTDRPMPKSGRVRTLDLRLAMAMQREAMPSTLHVQVPIFEACAHCHGSGFLGAFACRRCGTTGYVETTDHVAVPLDPSAQRAAYDVALDHLGIRNLQLHLRVALA